MEHCALVPGGCYNVVFSIIVLVVHFLGNGYNGIMY